MIRVLSAVVVALMLALASAVDLPDRARLTLVSADGVVLGIGEMESGRLTLTLEAGAEGAITLLINAADGTVLALEAELTASGQVLVTSEDGVEDLALATVAAGGEVILAFRENTRPTGIILDAITTDENDEETGRSDGPETPGAVGPPANAGPPGDAGPPDDAG